MELLCGLRGFRVTASHEKAMIMSGVSTVPLGGSIMNKLIILLVSVSALSLAACGDQTAQNTTPATPPASTDASKTAAADPAKPADAAAPAADPAKPAVVDATKPADPAAPAASMAALDPQIQTMIDGLKVKATTMSPEEKTKSVADVRTAAEGAAKTAGKSDAEVKAMGDAAEAAVKAALGV
jgi:hypothetical protein